MKDKKILVTGGAGLLGMNLTKALRGAGAKVTATYHHKQASVEYANVDYIHTDLTFFADCLKVCTEQDYVIMSAAVIAGAKGMSDKSIDLVTPNNLIQLNLLKASHEAGVKKVIFFGSTTEYPDTGKSVKEEEAFIGDPYEKYFPIGWYKRYGEKLCEWYNKLGMNVVVLRPSNIYGPHDNFDPATSHVTAALIRKVLERQNPLVVWGDGSESRDLIYVDDMVDAVLWAIGHLNGYNPVNIGSGINVTVKEILDILCGLEGFSPLIQYDNTQPTMIPIRKVDVSKATGLGFQARIPIKEGLRQTIKWYKENLC